MKIVFLNTLDAELKEPLTRFLRAHIEDTDVFCFQECYKDMHPFTAELFGNYAMAEASKPEPHHNDFFRNATFVRNDWKVESACDNAENKNTGLFLSVTISKDGSVAHIGNVHGTTKPKKYDTPGRLEQSQEIIDAYKNAAGAKIIGGDFNLMPDTQSVQLFRDAGYEDLITKFGIQTTRNEIAWKKYPGAELAYSDFVFVKDAEVISFEVPAEIVSDHQPMIVRVNIA